jgi:hypothetical protein
LCRKKGVLAQAEIHRLFDPEGFVPLPPPMVHEYQNRGLAEFAFHKYLISKGMFLIEQASHTLKNLVKKKSGSKLPQFIRSNLQN